MLNVTLIRGANQYAAAHYFSAADDYYVKENPGQWQGRGAEYLGLSGPVEQSQLSRLLNGSLPTGERIQASFGSDAKKRMGLDFTFSAPKSVSMQALVGNDLRVVDIHDKAVQVALVEVEKLAEARQKVQGKTQRERTGNLVIGKFRHEMSRAKDPQLHTHALILNMTKRGDGQWRALANEDLFKIQHEIDAIYKSELAHGLTALGYGIRLVDDKGNFELSHLSREQIMEFSARSQVIEEALEAQGKSRATASSLEKQVIALATRPRKDESERAVVKQYWIEKSENLGIDYEIDPLQMQAETELILSSLPPSMTPAQAVVQYAIRHLTERESVMRHSDLLATASQRAVGLTTHQEVQAELHTLLAAGTLIESSPAYTLATQKNGVVLSSMGWRQTLQERKGWSAQRARRYVDQAIAKGSLVVAEKRYTTQAALKREKAILAIERAGRGAVSPLLASEELEAFLSRSEANDGQKDAIRTILGSDSRFVGIQGDAGTGKSYTINQAVNLLKDLANAESGGVRTLALAPYGNQVKALKEEGLDAHTLASFLKTKNKPIDSQTLILLDEAAVVGSRQMERLMKIVEGMQARLVLIGDTKQTEAIEAGRPFAQLQHAGMLTARIHEIQRQKDPELKQVVQLAASQDSRGSLSLLKGVQEIEKREDRYAWIVSDYLSLTEKERESTLIITGLNLAKHEINKQIRMGLGLKGKGRHFETLGRVDMTQAQRRFAPSYKPGMVVQFEKDYPSLMVSRGQQMIVSEALPGNLLRLRDQTGDTVYINPRKISQLSVYAREDQELSPGDLVRINRNDPELDLTNGDRFRVQGVLGGVVKLLSLDGKREVELIGTRPLHLELSYSSTVHSAQGLTADRTLIDLESKSRTTTMNLYYVAVSRARYASIVYTDSIQDLPQAIARQIEKTQANTLKKPPVTSLSNEQWNATKLKPKERQMKAKHSLEPSWHEPR